jgi:SAM-dependent methyltransferase
MRYCGASFRNDEVFLASGVEEAKRLVADFELNRGTRLLEIGCGPGRLPIGVIALGAHVNRYDGVDIDKSAVDWCRRHITRTHPEFRFHAVDAQHERYNPTGRPMKDGFRLKFPDASFDLIYLHSVFANLVPDDVSVYCREFERVLRPGGKVFLTAFLEKDVPDVTINPSDYIVESAGALTVARYDVDYFFALIRSAALEIVRFDHRGALGGQSTVHLRKRPEAELLPDGSERALA